MWQTLKLATMNNPPSPSPPCLRHQRPAKPGSAPVKHRSGQNLQAPTPTPEYRGKSPASGQGWYMDSERLSAGIWFIEIHALSGLLSSTSRRPSTRKLWSAFKEERVIPSSSRICTIFGKRSSVALTERGLPKIYSGGSGGRMKAPDNIAQ